MWSHPCPQPLSGRGDYFMRPIGDDGSRPFTIAVKATFSLPSALSAVHLRFHSVESLEDIVEPFILSPGNKRYRDNERNHDGQRDCQKRLQRGSHYPHFTPKSRPRTAVPH